MLPPYHCGASRSHLIKILQRGEHYSAKLSEPEMARLITWIDVGVPCFSDYPIPSDNYFRKKRGYWQAEEAENIRQYLARPR